MIVCWNDQLHAPTRRCGEDIIDIRRARSLLNMNMYKIVFRHYRPESVVFLKRCLTRRTMPPKLYQSCLSESVNSIQVFVYACTNIHHNSTYIPVAVLRGGQSELIPPTTKLSLPPTNPSPPSIFPLFIHTPFYHLKM